MPFDYRQLLELAPFAIGAFRPGSPEAAAMMHGYLQSKERLRLQQLQEAELQDRDAYRRAQMANLETDNARAQQQLEMAQSNAQLNRLERFRTAGTERAADVIGGMDLTASPTDPTTQNQIASDLYALTRQYGVPAEAAATVLPNTTGLISMRKKKRAQGIYDQAEKTYGPEALANDAITIQTEEFGPMKPSQLRALYQPAATIAEGQAAKPFVKHARAFQAKDVLVNGKPTMANYDPESGQYFDQTGQPFSSSVQPVPPRENALTGSSALTPEGIDYAATQYRVTGVMPALGMGNASARAAIINTAATQAKGLGQSAAQSIQKQAAYTADKTSLTKMRSMSAAAEAFEAKALQQADIVSGLSQRVNRTQWPFINRALLAGEKEIAGDTNTQLLYNAISTFTTEYAKIMEGSTGSVAASSESARKQAAQLISAGLNKGTLQATLDLMKREMRLTIQGYDVTIGHITDRMGGLPPSPSSLEPSPIVQSWIRDPKTGRLVKAGTQ